MNKNLKFALAGLTLGCIGFIIGSQLKLQAPVASLATDDKALYAMNVVVSHVPFWQDTRETWAAIGNNTVDIKTEFGGPKGTDAQKQIEEIESLLAKGIKGLIVAPADSAALAPVIDRAADKGVTVITYLVDAPKSKRVAYVASELENASIRVAESLVASETASGKTIIAYAQAGNEEQEARRRGFEEFIARHPDMEIVGVVEDGYDEAKGAEQIKALLARHPDVKYIFGANSRSAIGAVTALREVGFPPGKVNVTGWDMDKDVLDLIKQRWVQRSVAQQSSYMTSIMFSILEARRKGYSYPSGRLLKENNVNPTPTEIVVPVAIITPKNVAGYYPKK